jgi:predicted MPP superfamily phosphohydrolase
VSAGRSWFVARPRTVESLALVPTHEARTRRQPNVRHFDVPIERLDPAHDGVRVAHLTDIHVGLLASRARIGAAVAQTNAHAPDVTVLTGDYVCFDRRWLRALELLIGGIRGPVVCVLGNHDHWTDAGGVTRALTRNGYHVLRNQHTHVAVRGQPIEIVGIDDAITRHADAERAFRGVSNGRAHRTRIVLTHVPGLARRAASHGPSLVLAGHTHGGQLRVPRLTDLVWRAVGKPYVRGFYRVGTSVLYVNSGVGTSTLPWRVGAPSEVAILTLRAPSAQ